jgi:hypothetical protein
MSTEEAVVISTKRTFSPKGFFKHLDDVQDGERMQLPEFVVPACVIDDMEFSEVKVDGECASVYDVSSGEINLVFDHAIMRSAIDDDWNETKSFKDTPLGKWLSGPLADAMRAAGIPVEECGLLRKEDMWGDNAKPFFQYGQNRVCFDFDEDYSVWNWTETVEDASAAFFCFADNRGRADCYDASYARSYVRPRFKILKP